MEVRGSHCKSISSERWAIFQDYVLFGQRCDKAERGVTQVKAMGRENREEQLLAITDSPAAISARLTNKSTMQKISSKPILACR
jgi:hypothetical protein